MFIDVENQVHIEQQWAASFIIWFVERESWQIIVHKWQRKQKQVRSFLIRLQRINQYDSLIKKKEEEKFDLCLFPIGIRINQVAFCSSHEWYSRSILR